MTDKPPGRLSNSNWCPHDLDTTADPKIVALLGKYGAVGYAVFWRLTELLHKEQDHRISADDEFILEAIAGQFKITSEEVLQVVEYAVRPCKLFNRVDGYLYSNRVLRNVGRKNEIVEKRREAGSKGGKSKAFNKHKQSKSLPNAKQNVAEESRVEEIYPERVYISDNSPVPNNGGNAPGAAFEGAGPTRPPQIGEKEMKRINIILSRVTEKLSADRKRKFAEKLDDLFDLENLTALSIKIGRQVDADGKKFDLADLEQLIADHES